MEGELFDTTGPGRDRATGGPPPEAGAEAAGSPLADRMRPRTLDEVLGQDDLLGPGGPLRLLIEGDRLPSLLLWGPPGSGKTTIARLAAAHTSAQFLEYSAVQVGAKELKAVMAAAQKLRRATGRRTILFLDEIHRFNKAQQDALLPWVERGDVTLIGATTENPSFEVNSALLSRTRLFVLQPLDEAAVTRLLERALESPAGLGGVLRLQPQGVRLLARLSEGDARAALGLLETAALAAREAEPPGAAGAPAPEPLEADALLRLIQSRAPRYDKAGEEHYNVISALHKALRNSDAQAGLYWLQRMLAGGEDPLYIARRLVRFASEDVGLADPAALPQALAARDAVHFVGRPEGDLALAQAVVYLALAPKSNALYTALQAVQREVAEGTNPPVPLHLRNAPTRMMKDLGFGKDYVYAHDTPEGMADMSCLPAGLARSVFYRPRGRGFERELAERLQAIARWHERRRTQNSPAGPGTGRAPQTTGDENGGDA